jgi:uncharacterized membrane protein
MVPAPQRQALNTLTPGRFRAKPELTMRRAPLLLTGLVLALTAGGATSAFATFNICNKSNLAVHAALGRFDGTNWTSQGWWTIQPKKCAEILTGPLDARYYYLYATDGGAGTWEGHTHFCVTPSAKFLAPGRADCARRGFDRRGFFEVDTGGAPNWIQTLSH